MIDDENERPVGERRDACEQALRRRPGNPGWLDGLLRCTHQPQEDELAWAARVGAEVLRVGAIAGALPGVADLSAEALEEETTRLWAPLDGPYREALTCDLARLEFESRIFKLLAVQCSDAGVDAKRRALAKAAHRLFSEDLNKDVRRGLRLMPTRAVSAAEELIRGVLELHVMVGPDEELRSLTPEQLAREWIELRSRQVAGLTSDEDDERLVRLERELDRVAFATVLAGMVPPAWACEPADRETDRFAIAVSGEWALAAMEGFTPPVRDRLALHVRSHPTPRALEWLASREEGRRVVASVQREGYSDTVLSTPLRPAAPEPASAETRFERVVLVEHVLRPIERTGPELAVAVDPRALGIWSDLQRQALGGGTFVLEALDAAAQDEEDAAVMSALARTGGTRVDVPWDGTTLVRQRLERLEVIRAQTGARLRIVAPAKCIAALGGRAEGAGSYWVVHTAPWV